jgi:hypothetical protein
MWARVLVLLVSIEDQLASLLSIRGVTIWPFDVMDESSSGKESWIMRLDGLVSNVVAKVDGLVVLVPGSKECHADHNSNEMCTLRSEERGTWEETPSGKAQAGGEISCDRLLMRENER